MSLKKWVHLNCRFAGWTDIGIEDPDVEWNPMSVVEEIVNQIAQWKPKAAVRLFLAHVAKGFDRDELLNRIATSARQYELHSKFWDAFREELHCQETSKPRKPEGDINP